MTVAVNDAVALCVLEQPKYLVFDTRDAHHRHAIMINETRRRLLESRVWPHVQAPAQYVGGERNIVVKDHRGVRGKLAIGFPDAYTIGMICHHDIAFSAHVQAPAQYVGGERNIVVKDHRGVRGKLCLGFPDAYTIGMSHHGLQVLYSLINRREDWCAERAFTPWPDMEAKLREQNLPLYTLETFTPLREFDVIGLSLQYEISS